MNAYLGLTQSEIGVVAGSLDVANLCFSFVIGSLISPSNKKAVLLTGTIISSAALSLFGLVDYAQGLNLISSRNLIQV